MAFEFYKTHDVIKRETYWSDMDEYRDENGQQMLVLHIDVDPTQFSPSVLKQVVQDWQLFRSILDAPIFVFEPNPNDEKWERFVAHMGFEYSSTVDCTDGHKRRCFISKKKNDGQQRQNQYDAEVGAVAGSAAVPSDGVSDCAEQSR